MTDVVERLRYRATCDADFDVISEEAADTIEALRAENAKLRAALKPFALSEHKIERWFGMDIPDSYNVVSQWVTVGDLRAAAAALKETGDE